MNVNRRLPVCDALERYWPATKTPPTQRKQRDVVSLMPRRRTKAGVSLRVAAHPLFANRATSAAASRRAISAPSARRPSPPAEQPHAGHPREVIAPVLARHPSRQREREPRCPTPPIAGA